MLVIIVSCCCRRRSEDGWVTPKAAGAATAFRPLAKVGTARASSDVEGTVAAARIIAASALITEFARDLYGTFPVKRLFLGSAASSLFGAGKAVLHPVACDQVPGARGRGQGTETLAKLGGFAA